MPTVKQHARRIKPSKSDTKIEIKDLIITASELSEKDKTEIELPVVVWDDPHPALKIKPEDEGKRVWIAGYPATWDVVLETYHEPGEPQFPKGGVDVVIMERNAERGLKTQKSCYFDEAILHPDELDEERLDPYFEIYDARKR